MNLLDFCLKKSVLEGRIIFQKEEVLICVYSFVVIRDPNDSRFDLEAYLNVVAAEAK